MWSRKAELEYLRRLTENLFPYILRPQALHSRCAPCIAQHRPFGRDASFSSVIPHTEFITPIMSKIEQSVKAFWCHEMNERWRVSTATHLNTHNIYSHKHHPHIPHTEFITPIMSKIEQSVKAFWCHEMNERWRVSTATHLNTHNIYSHKHHPHIPHTEFITPIMSKIRTICQSILMS